MSRTALQIAASLTLLALIAGVHTLGSAGGERGTAQVAATAAKEKKCDLAPLEREFDREPYYEGRLVEPHLHLPSVSKIVSSVATRLGKPEPAWDKELTLPYVHCLFEAEGTSRAFSFHLLIKYSVRGEVAMAKRMEKRYPGEFIHFLMPTFINSWIDVEVDTVRGVLTKNPGLFKGLGELKMFDGRDPDDPKLLALYDLAKEYNLIVMMHPFNHHLEAVERMVRQYPEVTFLLHGIDRESDAGPRQEKDNIEWVMRLIGEYPNVYYSMGNQLSIYGFKREHGGKVVSKEVLLPHMREQFDEVLASTLARWKGRIEAYPDKFLGAETDRWYRPHFDEEMSGLMNEFIRSFIGGLSANVRARVAYGNAEVLLSAR